MDYIVDYEIARNTDAGHARLAEYMSSKTVSHLNDAVQHFQLALGQCPVGHPDHAAVLTNLAYARLEGYIKKDLQDIDTTTSLFRDALALRLQGHPDRALSLYLLIRALIWRFSEEPTAVYIHESALLCCELLSLCPEGTYLRNIGVDPTNKLLQSLWTHFQQWGSIDHLDECIQLGRVAISLCPEGHSGRDDYLNNLAFSLQSRFDHQGQFHDLDKAISLHEEALHLRPVGHKFRDFSLGNLGGALIARFNYHGFVRDINGAVNLRREALMLRPHGHPRRDTALNNLALALKTRYEKSRVSEDLNEAINLYRESLRLKRHDHPNHHISLYSLSSALCARFTHTQENEDIEEAIRLCQESLAILPSLLHPDRYFSYMWLQEAYLSRYRVQHNPADLPLAVENFRLASRHPTQGFPERIKEAIDWAHQAEVYQHESALEAYQLCLELFDNHMITRSSIISRRDAATAFGGAQSLPVDAASCAIRSHDLQRAVELVEQGRGQQWSMSSRLRTPLDDIKSASPPLADKLSELSMRLSSAQDSVGSVDRAAADLAATEYRTLTKQWEAAVDEIRQLQGFSRFLLPPSYKEFQEAARHGPVIILIASQYSCSAIVVPMSGEPHHVRFPRITLAHLEKLKHDFATEIRRAAHMHPGDKRKKLKGLLRKVWDEVMLPIVNILQHDLNLRCRSRIWLCPTAAFTSIPLHAANPFRMNAERTGKDPCLEDLYICSYTPTLSALIRARQAMKTRAPPSFAAIGQSEPGAGQGDILPFVDSELEVVHNIVSSYVNFTHISGDNATQASALNALRCNTWVHLACHGKQDHEQPYNSRFAMRDKPLTLLDIMENNSPQAEFTFLSVCHTAVGDEQTPDEAIHLAAGLQFAGFKSVIGTLWVVNDALAKYVVEAFYQKMFEDLNDGGGMECTKAAQALNHATNTVKEEVPLEQRMVFIYIGV
ncbi:CHAT domain-containing protein [Suillus clintonianus]|uniref:CHAT domain-containing protein n=1 Tax=Suillus clintonianus TaxID=1904413 RepID=UPI001B88062F|nr:CHAT domain-containing protein [Suillus clintonianus]KAG2136389.1 CHAT domain-containing protein [Suillus clintonianus]